jgi:hypothetical protein
MDLIRPRQQGRRDREAEGLGGLEVDHEFEARRLFDRQAGRLCARSSGAWPSSPLRHDSRGTATGPRWLHALLTPSARIKAIASDSVNTISGLDTLVGHQEDERTYILLSSVQSQ